MQVKSVKDPGKQRHRLFNAPAHIRHKLMSAHLSPDLVKSHGIRTLPVRKGDTVRIMRGDHYGFEGKISRVDLKNFRIFLEGLTREKVDGTVIFVAVHPSKVLLKNLNLDDKWRKRTIQRKKPIETKEEAPIKKVGTKAVKPEVKEAKPPVKAKTKPIEAKAAPVVKVEEKLAKKEVKPVVKPVKPAEIKAEIPVAVVEKKKVEAPKEKPSDKKPKVAKKIEEKKTAIKTVKAEPVVKTVKPTEAKAKVSAEVEAEKKPLKKKPKAAVKTAEKKPLKPISDKAETPKKPKLTEAKPIEKKPKTPAKKTATKKASTKSKIEKQGGT
jgi:large subunit ribosomal protein L24